MRSVNVKRVAAVATGAALVGAAAAAAVTTDTTGLESFPFYSGPEPNVKIVVGSASQASDGVNAANVAAMIGNLAYDSTEIEVLNTDMLSCGEGSGEGGSATCTAMVKTPTVNTASAYLMKTYVEDRLQQSADTARGTTNTWYGGTSGLTDMTTGAKMVSQDHTSVLSMPKGGEVDNDRGLDVQQEQKVYLGAYTYYDTVDKEVQAKEVRALYETTFSDPLPACWDTTKTYADCDTSDKLERSRTKINFLGDEWVVADLTVTAGSIDTLKLGKEVAYNPVMNTGDEIVAHNGVKVVLDGLSGFGYGTNTEPKATFLIYDENDVNIDTAILQPGDEYKGNGIFLHVYDATSTTGGADYVEVSVFSDTVDLQDGNKISDHGDWKVAFTDGAGTTSESLQKIQIYDDTALETLNKDESLDIITNAAGFKFNFLGMNLEESDYDDLTLQKQTPTSLAVASANYVTGNFIYVHSGKNNAFKFESDAISTDNIYVLAENSTSITTPHTLGTYLQDAQGTQTVTTGDYYSPVLFTQNASAAGEAYEVNFTCTDSEGTVHTDGYAYFTGAASETRYGTDYSTGEILNCMTISSVTLNGTDNVSKVDATLGNYPEGSMFYYHSQSSVYKPMATVADINNGVQYHYSSSESAVITVKGPGLGGAVANTFTLAVPEITEEANGTMSTTYTTGYPAWLVLYDQNADRFANAVNSSTSDRIGYLTTASATMAPSQDKESGYISWRGSEFQSLTSDSATIKYATKLGRAQFTLTKGETTSTGLENERTAGVGEYLLDSDGYSVEVTQVGGEDGGVCELTGVENLEPSLDQAYEVAEIDASANPVVVLDSSPMASAGSRVIVGGPMVNSVAAEVLSGTTINPGDAMVKVVGSDVVVVGYSASDTTGAANALIEWLSNNRDNVVR